jgi:hypothetical protein
MLPARQLAVRKWRSVGIPPAGSDLVLVAANVFNSTGKLDGGAGTADVVGFSDQAAVVAGVTANVTGFEVMRLTDDDDNGNDTFNTSLINGIVAVQIGAMAGGDFVTVNNLDATRASAVTILGSQADGPVFGVTGATTVGQLDVLGVTINDTLTAKNTLTVANLTAAGVETVNIATVDNLTLSSMTGLAALTNMNVTGSGNVSLTTGALVLNVNTALNASGLTGTFTIDASAATANGMQIVGSATKANTITGTNQDDVIVGGTAVDIVKNQANAATDADTVNFQVDTAADQFEITTLTGKTTITNFDAATATTAEDLVNVSNNLVDGAEVRITAAAGQGAIATDTTYVIEQAVGGAAALTTAGSATLATADFTAATLTNLAAYLSERFTGDNDTVADENAIIVLNNGTNSFIYAYADSTTANTTIDAGELTLLGVVNGAILEANDVIQTV